jgi:hypothetical protein
MDDTTLMSLGSGGSIAGVVILILYIVIRWVPRNSRCRSICCGQTMGFSVTASPARDTVAVEMGPTMSERTFPLDATAQRLPEVPAVKERAQREPPKVHEPSASVCSLPPPA